MRPRVHRRLPGPLGDDGPEATQRRVVVPDLPLHADGDHRPGVDPARLQRPQRRAAHAASPSPLPRPARLKLIRYSKSASAIAAVFEKQWEALLAVLCLAICYILVSALVIFNVEPETFNTFFDAVYWAVVSLTTVGYGDLYPSSDVGRAIAMISSLMGVAVVALPSGIITAGMLDELRGDGGMNDES